MSKQPYTIAPGANQKFLYDGMQQPFPLQIANANDKLIGYFVLLANEHSWQFHGAVQPNSSVELNITWPANSGYVKNTSAGIDIAVSGPVVPTD